MHKLLAISNLVSEADDTALHLRDAEFVDSPLGGCLRCLLNDASAGDPGSWLHRAMGNQKKGNCQRQAWVV